MRLTVHSNLRVRREKELIAHWVGRNLKTPAVVALICPSGPGQ
ncbi:MAG: hypothetical protein QOH31_3554 [Verrucomicrobiota bacterium]|jgi:hypothetical protein